MSSVSIASGPGREVSLPAVSERTGQWAAALVQAILGCAGVVVLASYSLLAIAHINDRYQINFVSSVYTALAARLNDGVFYPDLFDGSHYAGTRYMPLQFVLHAGLARLTGEYLLSGKMLSCGFAVILIGQLFVILRRLGCGRGVSLALLGLVLVSNPGFLAGLTIRGDLAPVVYQLAALLIVGQGNSTRRAGLAAIFCTLAILTKITAGWAPLAIGCFYLVRGQRRCAFVFLGAWLGTLVMALAALHLGTSGRMLANFRVFSVAGVQGLAALLSPVVFLYRLGRSGGLVAFLVPLLIAECVLAIRQRRCTLYHFSLFFCMPILLAIYADMGADYNHLLDLVVLAVPVLGCMWNAFPPMEKVFSGVRPALAMGLAWVLFMSWTVLMDNPVRAVVLGGWKQAAARFPAQPLAGVVPENGVILSEDPWVEISRGQTPHVLDAFSVARMTQSHPEMTAALVRRIEERQFTHLVLLQRFDQVSAHDRYEWEDRNFGKPVVQAMRKHYRLLTEAEGYCVYVPVESRG
jgi:hypothetical protein